ncbi:DUF1289 domain-containing protein [Aquabacterium sp. OR-4]|uniref:DUF1289 domain-containing protein n=1 Tax=Aquabacterium sp. OR-4 TaxID=2978127 RepID=UPI003FCEDF6F
MGAATPVASPCINVCRMNAASGWCEGCLRSLDEIAAWGRLDEHARRAVWAQLDPRRQQLAQTQAPIQPQTQAQKLTPAGPTPEPGRRGFPG